MAERSCRCSHLNPEQTILLAAARSELRPDHERRIRSAARQGVDWDSLWTLARSHGVGYFVGRHLQRLVSSECSPVSGPDDSPSSNSPLTTRHSPNPGTTHHSSLTKAGGITEQVFPPPSFLRRVKEDLCRETARALVLREYQLRLNAELERSKLPFLWLKGLILAERLYGKFEARHCGDLDILVALSQVPRAKEILGRLGFEPYHPPLPGQEFHPMAAHHTVWSFRLSDDWLMIVELHHRLSGTPACQAAFDHLLQRSRTVDFQGQASRIPSIEDELLILSLHAHHHNYSLLRCLMDLAEYVKCFGNQLNWPKLISEARVRYWLGRLRAALEITDAVLGLDSADDIFSQIPVLTPRQRWACRRLPINALLDPASQSDDRRQAQLALLMDRWGDVFRLFAARILPAEEHVRMICPTFLAPYPALPRIYYFFHAVKKILPGFA